MTPEPKWYPVCCILLALVAVVFAASPAPAQELLPAVCGSDLASTMASPDVEAPSQPPLTPEERLFYPTAGLGGGEVVAHWRVEGQPYVTETIDLAAAESPAGAELARKRAERGRAPGARTGQQVFELLALRPDLVRELRALHEGGAAVEVALSASGVELELHALDELDTIAAELRSTAIVPLIVSPTVAGPAAEVRSSGTVRVKNYLEDCGDCTTSTPCDTECGWDDGKGGPVTCGEYGVCVPPTCECSYPPSDSWTGWYLYAFYPIGPVQDQCMHSWRGGSAWHQLHEKVYRRDLVRRQTICPNCPSCSGCYVDEQVIGYQLAYQQCYLDTWNTCAYGYRPCCSVLCEVTGLTPCHSYC